MMSTNRVDSQELRMRIRRLAQSELDRLGQLEGDLSLPGAADLQRSANILTSILEALDDHEKRLPQIVRSARAAQEDNLV